MHTLRYLVMLTLLALVGWILVPASLQAATVTASGTKNWSALTGGSGAGGLPNSTDTVSVSSGATLTVDTTAICSALTYAAVNANSTVTVSGSNTLSVTNAITIPRPASGITAATLNVGAGTVSCGSLTMSATTSTGARKNVINISTGTLTCSGVVTCGTTGCEITFSSTGTLNLGYVGAVFSSTPSFTASTGTVNYTGSGNQTIAAFAYNHLTFSGSGAKSMATGTSVAGILSIAPTGSATASVGTGLNLSVGRLSLGGTGRVSGTWGSTTATGATNQNNTYFAATTGYLSVATNTSPSAKDFLTFGTNVTGSATTINTSNGSVAWLVDPGTDVTTLAPTFTHTGASVSTASGTARNFTSPQTYTITATDTSTKVYTVTVTVSPVPLSGLIVWLKADAVNTGDSNQIRTSGSDLFVQQWNDSSGAGRNATNATQADQPKYIANALNGKPVIRFTEDTNDTGDRLYLGDLSAQTPSAGSLFAAATPNDPNGYTLFDNRSNDGRWVDIRYGESTPGTWKTNRAGNSGTAPWPLSGSHIFAMESSSSVYRYLVDGTSVASATAEYNNGSGQIWTIGNRAQGGGGGSQLNGDIAEVILYNRVLSTAEANTVGGYLAGKYAVTTTNYPVPAPAAPTGLTATPAAGSVNLSWTAAANATSYNVQRAATSGGTYTTIGTATGTTYADSTVAAATTYYYVVSAQNSGGASPISNEAGAARLTSSAKSILTFGANVAGSNATIDTGAGTIAWTVQQGAVVSALSPTFTLSPFASSNPASGTQRDFTTPKTYTITAEDNSTQVYTVTVTVEPGVPVTDGLIVWLKAGAVNTSDTNQVRISGADTFVKQWNDQSGGSHNASNTTDATQPKYIANALNGKPVLRFAKSDDTTGSEMTLGDLSASFPSAGTIFAVATVSATTYNIFGNEGNDERWVNSQWSESHPGSFRGSRANGTFNQGTWPTSGSHVFALESSSTVYRVLKDGGEIGNDTANYHNGSGQNWTIGDRANGGGQQFGGDIPEFILYNRVLSTDEASAVGRYLANKYGVSTTYPLPAVTPDAPTGLTATAAAGAVSLSWTASTGTSTYNVQRAATSGGTYSQIGTSSGASYSDSTATLGTTYYYVVTAQNTAGTSGPSNETSGSRLANAAKDILSFGPGALITGTSIAWTVPPGTSVTALTPTYTVSAYAAGSPVSGTSRNFTTPQTYTITAENNSTQVYTVTVSVASPVPSVTTLDVSAAATGAEIANSGTLVEANHFGNATDGMQATATITLANGLTFGTDVTHMTSGWSPWHGTASWSGMSAITDLNYRSLMSDTFWIAYGNSVSYLDIPNLTVGHSYRLQLISVAPQGSSVVVEGASPVTWSGNSTPSVLTYYWTAADTTANVVLTRTGGEINFNAYALHDITPVSAPPVPSNLAATPTVGQVSLSWTASSGATSYSVKRSTTSGTSYASIGTPTDTSYTDTAVTNGTPYYYVVSASGSGGESDNSSEVSATPPAAAVATTTTLATSGTPTIYGDSVTLTASVTPTPTGGTVQFYDNAVALGNSVAVSGGQAQLTTSALTGGTHPITATYSGTTGFVGSSASAMSQVVSQASQTLTFGVLAAKSYGGAAFDLTATASSGLTVGYASSDESVATVAGSTVTILKAGSTTLTASQAGDTNTSAATPVARLLTVNQATPTYKAPAAGGGTMVTMVVNARGNSAPASPVSGPAGSAANWNYPNPSITDNWQDANCANMVDSVGTTTGISCKLHFPSNDPWGAPALEMLKTGLYNSGDPNYGQCEINGLTPGHTYNLYIASARINDNERSKGTFRTTNTADNQTADVDCSSGYGSNSGGPRNGVTWVEGNNYVAFRNVVADSNGKILFTANENCAPHLLLNGFQLVAAAAPTPDATALTYGQPLSASTLGGTFTGVGGTALTGTLAFSSPATVPNAGTASHAVTFTPADTTNYASGSTSVSVTVNPADQTISFAALATKTYGDAAFNLTATSNSGLALSYASSDESVARVSGSTVTLLKAGNTTITASQTGDANHHAATPVPQALTVRTPYATWLANNQVSDSGANLQAFAFGTNPAGGAVTAISYDANGLLSACGPPESNNLAVGSGVDFRAVFCRRVNAATAGLTYTVEFSVDDFAHWETNSVVPTVLATDADGVMEVVSVPYPMFIPTSRGVEKPRFFRVGVSSN